LKLFVCSIYLSLELMFDEFVWHCYRRSSGTVV
jgi:hypothetical protein